MKTLRTQIDIKASTAIIWSVLTDFDQHNQWNPFITDIEGYPKQGQRLRIKIKPPKGKAMTITPLISEVRPEQKLVWKGCLWVKGLFDGEHRFEIQNHGHHCTLLHEETFSGLLLPIFKHWMLHRTRQGFLAMNTALKDRAEKMEKTRHLVAA